MPFGIRLVATSDHMSRSKPDAAMHLHKGSHESVACHGGLQRPWCWQGHTRGCRRKFFKRTTAWEAFLAQQEDEENVPLLMTGLPCKANLNH